MNIVTYVTESDVPERFKVVGHIINANGFLPIRFSGASEEEVHSRAEAWLTEESEKARKKQEKADRMSERVKRGNRSDG
jgi:hypothetical protein